MSDMDTDERAAFDKWQEVLEPYLESGQVRWVSEYIEPGYSLEGIQVGILVSDWNYFDEPAQEVNDETYPLDMFFSLEWEDEWSECGSCYKLVRTQADCYSWTPSYALTNGELICHECLHEDEYLQEKLLEEMINNPQKVDTVGLDLEALGFHLIEETCDRGWYRHNANQEPDEILKGILQKYPDAEVVFGDLQASQFETSFSVYVRMDWSDEIHEELKAIIQGKAKVGELARSMERGLKEASKQMADLQGDGVKYAKIGSDGQVSVRMVSQEEFIKGIK